VIMAEQKTPRLTKRMKTVRGKVDRNKFYLVDEALQLVRASAVAKFDESVDVAVNLGVDPKKSDQTVRGSVVLPSGTGKKVRVAVFAQGQKAKDAQEAGADIVGGDELCRLLRVGGGDEDAAVVESVGDDEALRERQLDPRPRDKRYTKL